MLSKIQRKFYYLFLITLFFLYASCGPGEVHPQNPDYYEVNLIPRETNRMDVAAPDIDCRTPGRGCMIPKPKPIDVQTYNTRSSLYSALITDYYNNNIEYFFTRPSFQEILPNIDMNSVEYYKLVQGEYKIHFNADSTILIYKNNDVTIDTNFVYAIQWK